MIRIAVVGDIGSGKSHAAKQFGYPVFDADNEVVELYKKNKSCFRKLKRTFPKYIFSFPVKKIEILNVISSIPGSLKKINNIVHPKIKLKMNTFIKKNINKKIVILDIPLLLENKINKKNDILVFIKGSNKKSLVRLKKRANFNIKIYRKLKHLQLPLEIKKKRSNFIINNNFNNKSLRKNVKKLLGKILSNA
ncbi:MAG: dephospho-CoA kinase [Pelagibacterales bacterium]|nr:dephospho-CoA kinase [Pelagibacterales bacterium]